MVQESKEKVSEKPACISPLFWAQPRQIKSIIAEIHAGVATGSTIFLILNPDLPKKPTEVFMVLDATLRRNQNLADRMLGNLIGCYGPGLQSGWIEDDLEAFNIIAK